MKRIALALLISATACADDPDATVGDGDGDGDGDMDPMDPNDPNDPNPMPNFDAPANCDPAPSVQPVWDHSILSAGVAALGDAYHGTADTVTNPGAPAQISGRFVYGLVLKDIEDETVLAYVENGDCNWQSLGEVITDGDGYAQVTIPGPLLTKPGAHNVELVVRGDDSRVRGVVWVVPDGTDAVVFDIDGTLTTSDIEVVQEILLGDEPEMYASADALVARYREANYFPIYVTGRPVYLDIMTRDWLAARGFAPGPVVLSSGFTTAALGVEEYKRVTLADFTDRAGVDLQFAYGNASTDICAYALAGIDPAATHIIGENRGDACAGFDPTVAITDYPSHLEALSPPAADHN